METLSISGRPVDDCQDLDAMLDSAIAKVRNRVCVSTRAAADCCTAPQTQALSAVLVGEDLTFTRVENRQIAGLSLLLLDETISDLERNVAANLWDAEAHLQLGIAYHAKGDLEEAEEVIGAQFVQMVIA